MTILSVSYTADGVVTAFSFPFWLQRPADLEVRIGAVLQGSGYLVEIAANSQGGTVTFATPPAAGATVTLTRDTEAVRRTHFVDGGVIGADNLNLEYDTLYALAQEAEYRLGAFIAWPAPPATGNRGVLLRANNTLTLTAQDPDQVAATVATFEALIAAVRAIAEQALAQTRPETGAALAVEIHELAVGTQNYRCAPDGLPAPHVNNVEVFYDGSALVPGVDYTLAVGGLEITLTDTIVSGAPTSSQLKAGQTLLVRKIAGGMITPDLSPGAVGTVALAAKAVTADKEADGTAHAVRLYDADGRPAAIKGAAGQVLGWSAEGVPGAGFLPYADAAQVRAAASNIHLVTAATVEHSRMSPLIIGKWWRVTANGAMPVAYLQATIAGTISMERRSVGTVRFYHPRINGITPLITAIAPLPFGFVSYAINTDNPDYITIETSVDGQRTDCDLAVAVYGSPA